METHCAPLTWTRHVLCLLDDKQPRSNAVVEGLLVGTQYSDLVGSGPRVHKMGVIVEKLPDPRVDVFGGRFDLCRREIAQNNTFVVFEIKVCRFKVNSDGLGAWRLLRHQNQKPQRRATI